MFDNKKPFFFVTCSILFALNIFTVTAQIPNDTIRYKNPPKWSLKLGVNLGGYQGVSEQMTYYFKEKYSVSFNSWQVFRNSKNTPSDYYYTSFFSKKTSHNVGEKLISFGLSTGYLIEISKTRSRLHLQAGINYNSLEYPDDFIRKSNNNSNILNLVSTNYSYSMYKKTYFSLVVSTAYEFPIFNHFGISLQPMLLISPEELNMMINFSINIGNATSKPIRKRKK